jgi:iron-sulfur cluster repair protein YtfE (RIC family)
MKREEQLQPLSHQHHNGLMAALLLKKGVEKAADPTVMGDFILSVWNNELRNHFIKEEVYLHPHVLQINTLMEKYEQMKAEHHQIRHLVDDIRTGGATVSLVTDFYLMLEKHIRFEERELFPFIEEHIQPEQLNELGRNVEQLKSKACSDYPVKFWE